jgi:DNA invertase Pin-like site-specific DNA recombinase
MIAAIYARVSTEDQKCDLQLSELRGYVERSGWKVIEYVETASGKAGGKRPALDRLLQDARLKKLDFVLVWKLDRFGRSLQHLIENVQTLDSAGIRFIVPSQNIDTDTESPGKFLMHIFGAFAEFERDLIVERVRAGVAEAKRQGKHCGRPVRLFRKDEALRLRKAGHSWRRVGELMGIPWSTVRARLENVQKVPRDSA